MPAWNDFMEIASVSVLVFFMRRRCLLDFLHETINGGLHWHDRIQVLLHIEKRQILSIGIEFTFVLFARFMRGNLVRTLHGNGNTCVLGFLFSREQGWINCSGSLEGEALRGCEFRGHLAEDLIGVWGSRSNR